MARLPVKKTYKLFIGGAFPRSESGRTYETQGQNVARASRKDVRDAVAAARAAQPKWASATAYNRGQVIYRIAEMMEARAAEFAELCSGRDEVERSIDRFVWYAGFADKLAQVIGSSNPVAGPYFNFTIPEPTGVVGVVAPETSSLLGLVSRLAPPLVAGNAVVVLTSESRPLPAITLTEVLATSDVPAGVVNVLTGRKKELVPVLAAHVDVDALDVWGVPDEMRRDTELTAADSVKRLARRPRGAADARFDWLDDRASQRPEWIAAYLEMKTVWHPIGV
jgi:acyl-CoA reductase-like NAD-dependent aldehyde dehydrogenase